MKQIFKVVAPDQSGYTFFSICVWEDVLRLSNEAGWTIPVRILEARYVIFGKIIHRELKIVTANNGKSWNWILEHANKLYIRWEDEFCFFMKSYQNFMKKNPKASGCRWSQLFKTVY